MTEYLGVDCDGIFNAQHVPTGTELMPSEVAASCIVESAAKLRSLAKTEWWILGRIRSVAYAWNFRMHSEQNILPHDRHTIYFEVRAQVGER